jgi:hypothetical protein
MHKGAHLGPFGEAPFTEMAADESPCSGNKNSRLRQFFHDADPEKK